MPRVALLFACMCAFACSVPGPPAVQALSAARPEAVRLWQDASIFQLVGGLIAGAKRRVLIEMYELGRRDLVRGIAAARARGADVRVVTDPTVGPSRNSAAELDRLGVPERGYPVDDRAHQIDHVKLLIADAAAAVGGMNWGAHSDRNHDYVLETHVPSEIGRLAQIFDQDWRLAGGDPAPLAAAAREIGQTAPGHEIRQMLSGALAGARARVLAEVYTLTDAEVLAGLADAHRRGLDVRVLLDPNQAYNRHAFEVLDAAGVAVRWYPVPRGALLHAKAGLFDNALLLGSANWTYSGLEVNHELDIETRDPHAVQAYGSRFEADWARSGP